MTVLRVAAPPDFRYLPTVTSHGWCVLPPFSYDEATTALTRLESLSNGTVVRFTILSDEAADGLRVAVEGVDKLTDAQAGEIRRIVARCLSFDHDLSAFYALTRERPDYVWIERVGAGRMLVSPTVWEDLAKTLLTTNTTWRQTKGMVQRLVELGIPYAQGGYTFPTPATIAALTPEALNAQVRAGYRGAYLHQLALDISEGRLDPESWRDTALPVKDVMREMKAIKGFGPYAIGAALRLLARFDELGLDSVCRTMFKTTINQGHAATDREIAAYYEPFGAWRGLAVWMDVLRDDDVTETDALNC